MPDTATDKTYIVRTYGCQMNVHDSERLSGLLEGAGYVRAADGAGEADVVVLNTCAVRENADNRLYGNLGHLASVKAGRPGMRIAVGGCLAQKDRGEITRRAPWVDVVFGTHNIGSLPVLLERARVQDEAQVEILESLDVFPSTLPTRRESAYAAWVSVSVGCNNTCTFCIVPALRGKEKDRRPGRDPVGDRGAGRRGRVRGDAARAERQRVRVRVRRPQRGGGFAKLLRACGQDRGAGAGALHLAASPGLHRRRDRGDGRDAERHAAAAHAAAVRLGHVLRAMRRSYRQDRYLGIIERVRAAMPDAAITTDIIVGFPGETEEDFEHTMHVVRQARFSAAFTFQYSKRPGTPAATMEEQVPKEVVQARYERLVALQEEISWEENKKQVGRTVELLVAEGEGRKNGETRRMSGRAPDNRLVHFAVGDTASADLPRPGDMVSVEVTYAAPHHLNADGADGGSAIKVLRRTRSGDAWQAGRSSRSRSGARRR